MDAQLVTESGCDVGVEEVKRLEGWMTFQEAADELGYTKQGFHRLVFDSARSPFDLNSDVRGVGDRPIMIVREEKVQWVKANLVNGDYVFGKSRLNLAQRAGE